MSNADQRGAIAAALSTVDGIRGFASRPRAPKPGNAWPQWGGGTRDSGHAFLHTWRILVILDQGTDTLADTAADRWGQDICDALVPYVFVDAIAPATVPVDGTDLYALMLTGRSE